MGCLGPMENGVCFAHSLPLPLPSFMRVGDREGTKTLRPSTYPPPTAPALPLSLRLPLAYSLAGFCLCKHSGERGSHTPCNLPTHSQGAPGLCKRCLENQGHCG